MNKIKLRWLFVAGCVSLWVLAPSCREKPSAPTAGPSAPRVLYTCSMHPQIRQDHPGDCPICSMKLVPVSSTGAVPGGIDLDALLKPSNEFIMSALPVTTASYRNLPVWVNAYGTIEYDNRAAQVVSSRISGRIEKLYMRYLYQPVEAGQKIMDIHSPEISTAQQNLLFVLKNDPSNTILIKAAKERLLLLGMSSTELQEVIQLGSPLYAVGIYSSFSGHLHDAAMSNTPSSNDMKNNNDNVTQELSLQEGMYVQKGQTLFMIMNHHKALAALQIYASDQSLVQSGNEVWLHPESDTSQVIRGSIDFIEPFFRANSRSLTARVYFHNAMGLPIGSHVLARIKAAMKPQLWLPRSAVLALGIHEVVLLRQKNGFIVHPVSTGYRSADEVQVISGLGLQDTVVRNAQYLIDSESFIKIP